MPENVDTGMLMMLLRRRMRSRSRVDPPDGREQGVKTSGRERTWQEQVARNSNKFEDIGGYLIKQ